MSKKKKKRGSKSRSEEEPKELDGRSAARALKAALAESQADSKEGDDKPREAPRRRRPPTSHGPTPARPKARPVPPPKKVREPGRERPAFHRRHDLLVVVLAVVLIGSGVALTHVLSDAPPRRFDRLGLRLNRPSIFLPPSRINAAQPTPAADGTDLPYQLFYQAPTDPLLRLEILVDSRPALGNLRTTRALHRASQYGEMVWLERSDEVNIDGRVWLRSRFRYAFKEGDFDSPRVASAIEFATLNGALVYAVTSHGDEESSRELADAILPTLTVDANHPAAAATKE